MCRFIETETDLEWERNEKERQKEIVREYQMKRSKTKIVCENVGD